MEFESAPWESKESMIGEFAQINKQESVRELATEGECGNKMIGGRGEGELK